MSLKKYFAATPQGIATALGSNVYRLTDVVTFIYSLVVNGSHFSRSLIPFPFI